MKRDGATTSIRDELASLRVERACDRLAEAAGLLRGAGRLQLHEQGAVGFEAIHTHAGVARRLLASMTETVGHPDRTVVEQPGQGHPKPRFVLHVERVSPLRLSDLGILDSNGHPTDQIPSHLIRKRCCKSAFLRGAFLARGSANPASAGPHLEIRVNDEPYARQLADLISDLGMKASAREHNGYSVVIKGERDMTAFLVAIGAHTAALAREESAVWKGLHAEANRMRNADSGNASRQGRAAATQIAAIEELEASVGLGNLPAALTEAARARLEDPEATLTELSQATGISRSAMADRLRRLVKMAGDGSGSRSPRQR
ncbi:MAG: DNA-binding protein WhiA [Actinomycetota bacterium]